MNKKEIVEKLLEEYGINDQRTSAWHAKRGEMLTASEIWKAFGDSTPAARHELIMSKLVPKTQESNGGVGALIWGTRFEPIAKEIYMKENGLDIVDTSCVRHPVHSFLGASPDGILIPPSETDERYGRLIEFKCPISRAFDANSPIPTHYVHQMQMQMECTGLDSCVYAEFRFKVMNYSEWRDVSAQYKSIFAVGDDGVVHYKGIDDVRDIPTWKREVLGEFAEEFQILYWAILFVRTSLVEKDMDWMTTHLPEMKGVWDEVVMHRENGTLPESGKEKSTLVL